MGTGGEAIQVTIGGKTYRLRGSDRRLVETLALRVDRALGEVAGPSGGLDDFKVGVLACLNLAAEHEERRTGWNRQAHDIRARAKRLEDRLVGLAARLEPVEGRP